MWAYYGWYELRLHGDSDTADPVITAAATVQSRLVDTIARLGPAVLLAILAAPVAVSVLIGRRARRGRVAPPPKSVPSQEKAGDPP